MKLGTFGRALLVGGSLAALGQQAAATNTSLEERLNYVAQAQATSEDTQTLFYRLLWEIRTKEVQRKDSFETNELYSSLGFLVYDDLNRLATKFGIKLGLDGLTVFSMGENTTTDEIVVQYSVQYNRDGFSFYRRNNLVFYSNKRALEEVDSNSFETAFRRLRIVEKNNRETVEEEDSTLYNRNFAYIIDMQKFDFQKVHRRLSELLYQRKKLDVSDSRRLYVANQVGRIANGLFKRYGGVPSDSFVSERDTFAGKRVISVFANQYFPIDIRCLFWLKIEGDQDAELFVQREANTRLGLPRKIGSGKIKPGESINTIVSEILK